jgi:predicted RNase H-like nuclease (RuvC/YqgF family)
LESQRRLKEAMESDVLRLREELDRLKGKVQKPKKKRKVVEFTNKRFKVLYKNLDFTDKAIEGFVSLTEEFQLKAEDVIHKLNEDGSLVSVRRKVFRKGGKMNVLEADFSYSGRIYFQKDSQPLIKIVAIGTKNTQEQDLAYLENLK